MPLLFGKTSAVSFLTIFSLYLITFTAFFITK